MKKLLKKNNIYPKERIGYRKCGVKKTRLRYLSKLDDGGFFGGVTKE